MLPDGRRLGAHLALRDGLVGAAQRASAIGAAALQVFSDNPTAWRRRTALQPELPAFRATLVRGGIAPLAIHGSYLINLAGPDPIYHERSFTMLAAELRTARRFGATLVNVHIGSHGGAGVDAGIERLVHAVALALELSEHDEPIGSDEPGEAGPEGGGGPEAGTREVDGPDIDAPGGDPPGGDPPALGPPATITLENGAGGGGGLGLDIVELAAIAAALDSAGVPRDRVGFCLDTAHAWGAGHDLSDPDATDALLEAFADRIGLDRLPLAHLNDSRSELGSRVDRHEHLGAGRIGPAGIAHLLRHERLAGATYIIETPGMDEGYDAINVARAMALARGEPMAPLPPGALSLGGSRARAATPRAEPVRGMEVASGSEPPP